MTLFEEIKEHICYNCGKGCQYNCLQLSVVELHLKNYSENLEKRAGNDTNSIRYQTLQEIIKEII